MSRFLGVRELGALALDGAVLPRSTRPWLIDLSMLTPYDGIAPGDIADFSRAPNLERWSLIDTPADEASRLRWIGIEDAGRQLLICDRVILVRVSWQDLADAGLIEGMPLTIDGEAYLCRVMTGGNEFRRPDDGFSGGSPSLNEWDRFVVNEAAIAGLPNPTPADRGPKLDEAVRRSAHNQLWNWLGAVSWTASPFSRRQTARCCRGYAAAQFFYLNTFDHRHEDIGWRPVLERLT